MTLSRVVVTGAAGFIGSHLVDTLLDRGCSVLGIDLFTDYYPPIDKRDNLRRALDSQSFTLLEADVANGGLEPHLEAVDTVFHLAAQPGVRSSWGSGFDAYVRANIVATQKLLETCRSFPGIRVVNASSSSVYGNPARVPTSETDPTEPLSPYGITKLAAEFMCRMYSIEHRVSTVSLRYFSVYGPRQRPDMAIRRLIDASLTESEFGLNGDGTQERDFTFVSDVVEATIRAATADVPPGSVYNVGGSASMPLARLIDLISDLTGFPIEVTRRSPMKGDAQKTHADIGLAHRELDWFPSTLPEDGLKAQIAWQLAGRRE